MKLIFLLGPKHCGKTTVGKNLADLCSCDFIDLDDEITRTTGKTPRQLYNEGLEIFQKAEIDSLRSLRFSAFEPKVRARGVLAAGGGIIDNQEAINIIKKLDAIIVYLDIPAETAWQRISASGELPPFLKTENPQETHRVLHERRAELYRQSANITINADGKTPEEISKLILCAAGS